MGTDGRERRRYPRFPGGKTLAGHGPDGEIRGNTTDQGPGGAFLETTEPVRMNSKLVLTVHDPFQREQPVFLVGVVVHVRAELPQGIGIRWKAAVSTFGLARLRQFLDTHFHLVVDPRKTGAHVDAATANLIAYDFEFGTIGPVSDEKMGLIEDAEKYYGIKFPRGFLPKAQYMEVKLAASDAESKQSRNFRRELSMDRAAMLRVDEHGTGDTSTQPINMEKATHSGLSSDDIAQWRYEMSKRKKTALPVTVSLQGKTLEGTVRNVSEESLMVVVEGIKPARGDRAIVEMPITVETRSETIVVVGSVNRVARDKKTAKLGVDIKIKSIDERDEDGLFSLFLFC